MYIYTFITIATTQLLSYLFINSCIIHQSLVFIVKPASMTKNISQGKLYSKVCYDIIFINNV